MLPAVLPKVLIMKKVARGHKTSVRQLCSDAGIECRVTGPSAERTVYLCKGKPSAARESGSMGAVSICHPSVNAKARAIFALGVLAYSAFDYASRESMRGVPESKMSLPLGRPRLAHPLTGAERQRKWRLARREELADAVARSA